MKQNHGAIRRKSHGKEINKHGDHSKCKNILKRQQRRLTQFPGSWRITK